MLRTTQKLYAAAVSRRPLQPFLLERFDGWNDSSMSLSSSECEPLSLNELLAYADDDGKELWEKLSLGYVEPSSGSRYLRAEILQAQFNQHVTAKSKVLNEECVNVCAPQEGIFLAIQALCSPGDHVIVTAPAYQSLHEVASSLGCEVTSWWPEEIENDDSETTMFRFNPETLQKLIRPNQTKLLVANFPHNPTGALPTSTEFASMVDIVQSHDSWFLVDEMYRGLEHPQQGQFVPPLPAVADCMPKGVSLGGVSKSFGLPGLRIGWLVNQDAAFQKRVAELKDYTSICPPAPSEALAFIALRAQTQLWQRSRKILADGLPKIRQFIQSKSEEHPQTTTQLTSSVSMTWCEPLGGTFAWVKLQSDMTSSTNATTASDYSAALRKRTGLMIVPSGLFTECQTSDNRLRLTFGRKGLDQLLQVWEKDLRGASSIKN